MPRNTRRPELESLESKTLLSGATPASTRRACITGGGPRRRGPGGDREPHRHPAAGWLDHRPDRRAGPRELPTSRGSRRSPRRTTWPRSWPARGAQGHAGRRPAGRRHHARPAPRRRPLAPRAGRPAGRLAARGDSAERRVHRHDGYRRLEGFGASTRASSRRWPRPRAIWSISCKRPRRVGAAALRTAAKRAAARPGPAGDHPGPSGHLDVSDRGARRRPPAPRCPPRTCRTSPSPTPRT